MEKNAYYSEFTNDEESKHEQEDEEKKEEIKASIVEVINIGIILVLLSVLLTSAFLTMVFWLCSTDGKPSEWPGLLLWCLKTLLVLCCCCVFHALLPCGRYHTMICVRRCIEESKTIKYNIFCRQITIVVSYFVVFILLCLFVKNYI